MTEQHSHVVRGQWALACATLICLGVYVVAKNHGTRHSQALDSDGVTGGIQVVGGSSWNAGFVRAGEVVRRVFRLHNVTQEPIEIRELVKTCGCTEATLSQKIVPQEGYADLSVTLDTTGKIGFSSVDVYMRGGVARAVLCTVSISATIGQAAVLLCEPSSVDVGIVASGGTYTAHSTVETKARWGAAGAILTDLKVASGGDVSVQLGQGLTGLDADAFEVHSCDVELRGTAPQEPGRFTRRITLTENTSRALSAVLVVTGEVRADLAIVPDSLFCDGMEVGLTVERSLIITLAEGLERQELVVHSSTPWLKAMLREPGTDTSRAEVQVIAAVAERGVFEGTIAIDCGRAHGIVPVTVSVR